MTFISSIREMASSHSKLTYKTLSAKCNGKKFTLQLADTFRKMATGLMGHDALEDYHGMLFVFAREGKHGFWMLNMKMSIDIIWLGKDKSVVKVWKRAMPCTSIFSCQTVRPDRKALYVVELRAGMAQKLHIKAGDKFSW